MGVQDAVGIEPELRLAPLVRPSLDVGFLEHVTLPSRFARQTPSCHDRRHVLVYIDPWIGEAEGGDVLVPEHILPRLS